MVIQKKHYQLASDAQSACALSLLSQLKKGNGRPIFLFYSGGSSLSVLSSFIRHYQESPFACQITLCAVDERFDPQYSNYQTMKDTYPDIIPNIESFGWNCIDTSPHHRNEYILAEWINEKITNCFDTAPLVYTLLGMGEDGHIAGIMPFEDEMEFSTLFMNSTGYVAYSAEGKNKFPRRCTATFPLLERSENIFLYAVGQKKVDVLEQIQKSLSPLHLSPASFLFTTARPVSVFTAES